MNQNLTIGAVMLAAAASCAAEIYAPTNGADATLAITNRTGQAVWYMNVRDCGTSDWGRDVLGTGVVTFGETVERSIPSGCHDIRIRTDPSLFGEVVWTHVDVAQGHTTARSIDGWADRQ